MPKTARTRFCSMSCAGKHYYHSHPEYRQAQKDNSRRRLAANPEAMAVVLVAGQRWRENNREASRAATSRWYRNNKERSAKNHREWWNANPEKQKEYRQKFRRNNPKKIARWEKNNTYRRRALKRQAEGSFTYEEFFALCNESGWICAYCGCQLDPETATADHMIPLSRGGSNNIENIAASCLSCNCSKKDKTPEEYRLWLNTREVVISN